MIVINTLYVNWPVEYIIYTATIPSAFTGADVAIFANAFAYISDVSTEKNRTIRITILDVAYLSTMPTGVALGESFIIKLIYYFLINLSDLNFVTLLSFLTGKYLFNWLDKSFTKM